MHVALPWLKDYEVSGSMSDVSLSVTYLRVVLLAKMSERLNRLVYRMHLTKIKQNRETRKSRRRPCEIHSSQCWKFTFK